MRLPLLLCCAVLLPLRLDSQVAGPPPGDVEGMVFDSTTSAPLAGADVYLWGTVHRAVTSSDGAFAIEGVPPGRYTLIFFHPRLSELGVSPGGFEVEVRPEEAARVLLAVPSGYTIRSARCALETEGGPAGGVPVVGRVTDAETGVAYPMARVTLSWPGQGGAPSGAIEASTDESGWYSACSAPVGVAVGVVADFLGRTSSRRELVLERGQQARVDLPLGDVRWAVLSGRLLEAGTGAGLAGAAIALEGTGHETTTDGDGTFHIRDVRPGRYTLVVRRLPYAPREQSVVLTSGQVTDVLLRLSEEAMALDPIEVTVERTNLTDRAMGGLVVTREQIDRVAPRVRDVADVLREQHVPGLIVRRQGPGACVGFNSGQARMHGRSQCVPVTVFIDGTRAADPYSIFTVPSDAIDRMILYRPIEAGNLFGAGSANGVLEVFTRW